MSRKDGKEGRGDAFSHQGQKSRIWAQRGLGALEIKVLLQETCWGRKRVGLKKSLITPGDAWTKISFLVLGDDLDVSKSKPVQARNGKRACFEELVKQGEV